MSTIRSRSALSACTGSRASSMRAQPSSRRSRSSSGPGVSASRTTLRHPDSLIDAHCNNAGFQIHKMVEFEETALDVKGRFRAVETVVGDLATAAEALADHLETTKRVQVLRRLRRRIAV